MTKSPRGSSAVPLKTISRDQTAAWLLVPALTVRASSEVCSLGRRGTTVSLSSVSHAGWISAGGITVLS